MKISPEHKESLKKVLTCFKKAGVDISTVSDIEGDSVHVEFGIQIKNKEVTVGIKYNNGDVYYEYFTSQDTIGNISSPEKITSTIKQGTQDNQMKVNQTKESVIKRLKEAVKKAIHKQLDEESSTGTGASFSAGQGEQYTTPAAFTKKGSAINRATKYLVKQGFMKVPDSKRFSAKSFDVEKWK